jgi:hypothetical protein
VHAVLNRNFEKDKVGNALDFLQTEGLASFERIKTKGRTAERWFSTGAPVVVEAPVEDVTELLDAVRAEEEGQPNLPARVEHTHAIAELSEEEYVLSIKKAKLTVERINRLVHELMEENVDYGKVPGIKKPSLFQEGATNLCRFFKMVPTYEREIITYPPHTTKEGVEVVHSAVNSTCRLHQGTADGPVIGEAGGACSTWEKKYRYRYEIAKCPECGKPAVIKGKKEYGGGFVCWAKKDGCGAKFPDNDKRMTAGEIEHPNPLDQLETVLQMADKRALVMVVRRTTGAGRLFTQDEEILQPGRTDGRPNGTESPAPEAQVPESPMQDQPKAAVRPAPLKPPKVEFEFFEAMLSGTVWSGDENQDEERVFDEKEHAHAFRWLSTLSNTQADMHKFRRFIVKCMKLWDERTNGRPLPTDVPPTIGSMAIDSLNWE